MLDQDLAALATPPYDVVANLPYHVTSPVLHRLLGGEAGPRARALRPHGPARGGGTHRRPTRLDELPLGLRPVPRRPDGRAARSPRRLRAGAGGGVGGARPRRAAADAPGRLPPAMEDDLWRLVQAGFRERRKMLHNVLPRQLPIDPATIAAALAEVGIASDRRPQTLGVGEWIALLGALGPIPADRRGRRGGGRAVTAPRGRVTPVVRVAPAKLNLTLAVVGRRPDGFHLLHSVMVTLDLADRLTLDPAFGPADRLHVVGTASSPAPDLGPVQENLVLRAIAAARTAIRAAGDDRPLPALAVRLEKRIPAAAGLGGGSSDAVAALDGALEAWGVRGPPGRGDAHGRRRVARVGLPVLRGRRLGGRRGTGRARAAGPAAPRRLPRRRPRDPGGRGPDARGLRAIRRGRPTGGRRGARVVHAPRDGAAGRALDVALPGASRRARVRQRPGPGRRRPRPRPDRARRALSRLLERPVGQSGSGPTLWALSASKADAVGDAAIIRAALADGLIAFPGDRPPFIAAAALAGIPSSVPS